MGYLTSCTDILIPVLWPHLESGSKNLPLPFTDLYCLDLLKPRHLQLQNSAFLPSKKQFLTPSVHESFSVLSTTVLFVLLVFLLFKRGCLPDRLFFICFHMDLCDFSPQQSYSPLEGEMRPEIYFFIVQILPLCLAHSFIINC